MALFGSYRFLRKLEVGALLEVWPYESANISVGSWRIEITDWTQKANFQKATKRSFSDQRIGMCLVKVQKAN